MSSSATNLAAVSWLADRIAVLKDGRIVEMADTATPAGAPVARLQRRPDRDRPPLA